MEAASLPDRSRFTTYHLSALAFLAVIGFGTLPFGPIPFAIPIIVALAPLPFYCVPRISEETARTCIRSAGIALLVVLAIYAAGFALLWCVAQSLRFM